jgi:hypothetical protein
MSYNQRECHRTKSDLDSKSLISSGVGRGNTPTSAVHLGSAPDATHTACHWCKRLHAMSWGASTSLTCHCDIRLVTTPLMDVVWQQLL